MTSRKIAPSGAGRRTTTGELLLLLPGGAGTGAPPDRSDGEGRETVARSSPNPKVGSPPNDSGCSGSGEEWQMVKPSWLPMDRFALADVRRDYRLTPMQAYLFEQLTKLATWRGVHLKYCTLEEICEFTGFGLNTVKAGMKRLVDEGLIVIHEPFRQRREGMYEVLGYRKVVVDLAARNRSKSEPKPRPILTDRGIDQDIGRIPLGIEGGGGISPRESLTREKGSAFDRIRREFPGAEEVS